MLFIILLTCWAAHWKINANNKISSLNNISICCNKYFRFRLCRCCVPALFLHRAASCLPINSWEGCQLSVWQHCALLTNVLNSPNFEQLFKHNNCHLYTISALKHKIRLGNYQNVERNLAIIDSNVPKKRNWKLDNGALKQSNMAYKWRWHEHDGPTYEKRSRKKRRRIKAIRQPTEVRTHTHTYEHTYYIEPCKRMNINCNCVQTHTHAYGYTYTYVCV